MSVAWRRAAVDDGGEGWVADVGPFKLVAVEEATGASWLVAGPGEPAEIGGTAPDVASAKRRAIGAAWNRWHVVGQELDGLEQADGFPSSKQRIHTLVHTLWTRDRHGGTYVKAEWMELVRLLSERGLDV